MNFRAARSKTRDQAIKSAVPWASQFPTVILIVIKHPLILHGILACKTKKSIPNPLIVPIVTFHIFFLQIVKSLLSDESENLLLRAYPAELLQCVENQDDFLPSATINCYGASRHMFLPNVPDEVSLLASGAEGAQAASVTEVPKAQGLAPSVC